MSNFVEGADKNPPEPGGLPEPVGWQLVRDALAEGIRVGFAQGVEWGRKYSDGDPPGGVTVTPIPRVRDEDNPATWTMP